jgi:hypothetical protein
MKKDIAMIEAVKAYVDEYLAVSKAKNILFYKKSRYSVFDVSSIDNIDRVETINNSGIKNEYDLIIGDFNVEDAVNDFTINGLRVTIPICWNDFYESLNHLGPDGKGVFLLGPWGFMSDAGKEYEDAMNKGGLFVNAYFALPDNILLPESSTKPMLVVFSRKDTAKLLIADVLSAEQGRQAAQIISGQLPEDKIIENICNAQLIKADDFENYSHLKNEKQMRGLIKQYFFEEFSLFGAVKDIVNINPGDAFKDAENVIYVPKHGEAAVVCRIADAAMEPHKYYQVVLSDTISADYLELYFKTVIGRQVLQQLVAGHMNIITSLQNNTHGIFVVALPTLKEQQKIVETHNKINILESRLNEFRTELAVNPISSKEIGRLVDGMLLSIDKLSDSDKVRALIRDGESKRIEFKETLSLNRVLYEKTQKGTAPSDINIDNKNIKKEIETAVLKTIVAFLNSNGGSLVVGVNDNGDITGLENEFDVFYKKSENPKDDFLLHLKNIQKERIGEKYYPFIESRLVSMASNNEERTVLLVECKPSKSPCHLDVKEFYIRTNPATDKLEGQAMIDYYEARFKRR